MVGLIDFCGNKKFDKREKIWYNIYVILIRDYCVKFNFILLNILAHNYPFSLILLTITFACLVLFPFYINLLN